MQIIVLCCCLIAVFSSVQLFSIELKRQESPRDALHRLPDEYQPFAHRLFKPKPPHNYTNDTVALYRYMDTEFYGVVGIGSPVRYFNMVFDTTWGNTWVISDSCPPALPACWFHNKYDGSKSSSHKDNDTAFVASENDYNISGFMSIDTLHLGHLKVTDFGFAEIDSLPWGFMLSKADGVVGMAQKDLVQAGSPPFFYYLFQQGIIKTPIFSVYLTRDPQSNHGGSMLFGAIDEKHYNGSFTYVRVSNPYYWQFPIQKISLNRNQTIYPFCVNGCEAVIDTSTTNIVGPKLEIQKINRLIGAKPIAYGRYEVDCALANKLPFITFKINGVDHLIKGPDYVRKAAFHGVEICLSSFMPAVTDNSLWYIGGAFLGKFYTTFDLANSQVGFAIRR